MTTTSPMRSTPPSPPAGYREPGRRTSPARWPVGPPGLPVVVVPAGDLAAATAVPGGVLLTVLVQPVDGVAAHLDGVATGVVLVPHIDADIRPGVGVGLDHVAQDPDVRAAGDPDSGLPGIGELVALHEDVTTPGVAEHDARARGALAGVVLDRVVPDAKPASRGSA